MNKWDINSHMTERIEQLASEMGARHLGRIPFDEAVVDSTGEGVPLVEHDDGPAAQAVRALWARIAEDGLL